MFLFGIESAAQTTRRINNLVERVLHRLGDSAQKIWTYEEIEGYVRRGAREMAATVKLVWDQTYLECLPSGFSYTSEWEQRYGYVTFDYDVASYTSVDEASVMDSEEWLEADNVQRANHTSPSDLDYFDDVNASTTQRGTAELPAALTDLDRVTWDARPIDAATHRRAQSHDSRYELTEGEVYAYTYQKDGPNTLRKIRIPSAVADIYTVDGSWGIVRNVDEVVENVDYPDDYPLTVVLQWPEYSGAVYLVGIVGAWGVPRQVQGEVPLGTTQGWGIPRRFYREGMNMRAEFYRVPHIDDDMSRSELPDRYFLYLGDFAQWRALKRNGPGQNYPLAGIYEQRWSRNLARIQNRINRKWKAKTHVLGDIASQRGKTGPPTPKLPWQYPAVSR